MLLSAAVSPIVNSYFLIENCCCMNTSVNVFTESSSWKLRSTKSRLERFTNTLQTLVFSVNFFTRWWLADLKKKAHAAVGYPLFLDCQQISQSGWYLNDSNFQAGCFPLIPLQKWLILLSLEPILPLPSSWSRKDPTKNFVFAEAVTLSQVLKKSSWLCVRGRVDKCSVPQLWIAMIYATVVAWLRSQKVVSFWQ